MQNLRFELLTKLQTKLGDAVTITDERDSEARDDFYSVEISLGTGWAGTYESGYWGNCTIENDELTLHFLYGDIYGEGGEAFGEGIVELTYKGGTDANGLAYTGELDTLVGEKLEEITGALITCGGSEQGMQGHCGDDESYLSVDVGEFETA